MDIPVFRRVEARPYTSCEKVTDLVLQLRASSPANATEAMLVMVIRQFSGKLLDELPADPAVLDDVLQRLSAYVLELRSDEPATDTTAQEA